MVFSPSMGRVSRMALAGPLLGFLLPMGLPAPEPALGARVPVSWAQVPLSSDRALATGASSSAPRESVSQPDSFTVRASRAGQHLLVVTDAADATRGWLFRMEGPAAASGREAGGRQGEAWRQVGEAVPVVVGRNGVGPKREGDGRAPRGVFTLGPVFGYDPEPPAGLSWPYRAMTPSAACVDDTASSYYNRLVDPDTLAGEARKDWNSAEAMRRDLAHGDDLYRWGVVVDYNRRRVPGRGSCIFLHVWQGPDSSTAGCTAMAAEDLLTVMRWLDPAKAPVLVQGDGPWLESLVREGVLPYPLPMPSSIP